MTVLDFPGFLAKARHDKNIRTDKEFLPAAMSIIETPASPIRIWLLWVICLLFAFALAWSYFGTIDIIAVAQGKVQPAGRVKLIQPLESGKVASINVENGSHVKAGEVLIEMDRRDATADEADAAATLAAWRAEALRRRAAIEAANHFPLSSNPAIDWTDDIPVANRGREQQVLNGDLAQLASTVAGLDAQTRQKQAEYDRLNATVQAQHDLIATLQQRVDMRSTLVKSGAGSKSAVIDAVETLQYQQTGLQTQMGQRAEAVANLQVLAQEQMKTIAAFVADNGQKLAEAQRQADEFEQKLAKAHLKSGRMALTSPIDGTVSGLSVTTVGQVISGGDELMRVVPADAKLEIECYLPNQDIGFVKPGQMAVVKVESFPFTRYGTLPAQVNRIAQDAIAQPDAQQAEADPTKSNRQDKLFVGAQRVQNLVFPVTLTLADPTIIVEGQRVPLSPGMAVSVEIATGKRRILDYLFSPIAEVGSKALRER